MMFDLLRSLLLFGGLATFGLASAARPAQAALVTYTFTGTISTLADPTGVLGGQVHLGDTFSGTLVYDTATATAVSTSATRSSYAYNTAGTNRNFVPPIGITGQAGTYAIQPDRSAGAMSLAVYNNAPTTLGVLSDGFIAQQDGYVGNTYVSSSLFLGDRTTSVFSSTTLPTTLATSSFSDGTFSFMNYTVTPTALVPNILFSGTINGLTPFAVPEPGSLTLLGGGLLAVGAYCRRSDRPRRGA